MEIQIINDGIIQPYILDPNFNRHLPTIPSEVSYVFAWQKFSTIA